MKSGMFPILESKEPIKSDGISLGRLKEKGTSNDAVGFNPELS